MKTRSEMQQLMLLLTTLTLLFSACKKLVEVPSPDSATKVANVYSTDATAAAVLNGIYANMSYSNATEFNKGGLTSMSLFPGLSADELTLYAVNSTLYKPFYTNAVSPDINAFQAPDYWKIIYPVIFTANSAIEGLEAAMALTPAVKKQLLGEAKFIRAFGYFYLVNLYGPVPLAVSSDWKVNSVLPRSEVATVYQQIIADLKDAQRLMGPDYVSSDLLTRTSQRIRPSRWTVTALLARAYLYTGDWTDAEAQASLVINNPLFYLGDLNSAGSFGIFGSFSSEAIWALQPPGNPYFNTGEGRYFAIPYGPNTYANQVYLSEAIANGFEAGDQRKEKWTASVNFGGKSYAYVMKYKYGGADQATPAFSAEFSMVFRFAEQYLIRAEARAHQNNLNGAKDDINAIRTRAGLGNTPANDQASLLAAVMQERKVELFTEWGHRWMDLKRTGKADAVMSAAAADKGASWQSTDQLYPIPASEIKLAPQLKQNPGYTP